MKPDNTPFMPLTATQKNLRTLCVIRLIPLVGMFFGAYFLLNQQTLFLQWGIIFSLLFGLCLMIVVTWLRSFQAKPISNNELFIHLLIDISIYSLLMFNTGGASNPFISYLLVPVTIAAITLPSALTWITGALCLAIYSCLLFWYVPVPLIAPGHAGHHGETINLHLLGMWMNFVVSAILIAYFINKMSVTLRQQQEELTRQKEQKLEDDQLLAVATLAASAAHELGTPLNTIQLIVEDWLADLPEGMKADAAIVISQIKRCQLTLKKLSGTARTYSHKEPTRISVYDFFAGLFENWQLMRPDARVNIDLPESSNAFETQMHPAITPCLQNLLNNAADASPQNVDISLRVEDRQIILSIRDYGPGMELPGKTEIQKSDKPHGMGLGLYLSRSILARHQCDLSIESEKDGTLVSVYIPMTTGDQS